MSKIVINSDWSIEKENEIWYVTSVVTKIKCSNFIHAVSTMFELWSEELLNLRDENGNLVYGEISSLKDLEKVIEKAKDDVMIPVQKYLDENEKQTL